MSQHMKKKDNAPKTSIVNWLWKIPESDPFWYELKGFAVGPARNWKSFGNLIRRR